MKKIHIFVLAGVFLGLAATVVVGSATRRQGPPIPVTWDDAALRTLHVPPVKAEPGGAPRAHCVSRDPLNPNHRGRL